MTRTATSRAVPPRTALMLTSDCWARVAPANSTAPLAAPVETVAPVLSRAAARAPGSVPGAGQTPTAVRRSPANRAAVASAKKTTG